MALRGEVLRVRRFYEAVSAKSTVIGILRIQKRGGAGIVKDQETGKGAYVSGYNMGVALHGDKVLVQLLARFRGRHIEGEIIKILEKVPRTFVGTYEKGHEFSFVVPDDTRLDRDIYIPHHETKGAKSGQLVVAKIEHWESRHLNPEGIITEVLGYPSDVGMDILSVAKSFHLPLGFPQAVEEEVNMIPQEIPREEIARRLDLRDETIITIDPADAKDFDDAISLKILDDGNYLLGVHIADVSWYVKHYTEIDAEALRRGTSVYLVDRVIPMLPEKLSNEICSLQPDVPRLTYSVFMTLDPEGKPLDHELHPSVICSKRRFSYTEAQAIIDKKEGDFSELLLQMHRLSRILKEKRLAAGSLDFETPEAKFELDEKGIPVNVYIKKRLETNEMIEEFMLLANKTVTKHIHRLSQETRHILPFVYRVHPQPEKDRLKSLSELIQALGYSFHIDGKFTSRQLQKLLNEVHGTKDALIVDVVAIRSMAKAYYSTENVGHFGLAFKHYTHFTSPIRRYPDLMVHRLLSQYHENSAPKNIAELETRLKNICEISSGRERNALKAERESVKVKQVEFMKNRIGEIYDGIISGVIYFGIFVEIMDYLIEGLIHIKDLDDDFYHYNEKQYALIGEHTEKKYRLGDLVKVRVVGVNADTKEINFILVK